MEKTAIDSIGTFCKGANNITTTKSPLATMQDKLTCGDDGCSCDVSAPVPNNGLQMQDWSFEVISNANVPNATECALVLGTVQNSRYDVNTDDGIYGGNITGVDGTTYGMWSDPQWTACDAKSDPSCAGYVAPLPSTNEQVVETLDAIFSFLQRSV